MHHNSTSNIKEITVSILNPKKYFTEKNYGKSFISRLMKMKRFKNIGTPITYG